MPAISETYGVALIMGIVGPVSTALLVAVVNHLLKQRDDERRETRRVVTSLRAQRDMYRARSARQHRQQHPRPHQGRARTRRMRHR